MKNENLPDDIYQKPAHEALINLINEATTQSGDCVLHLLQIIPLLEIKSAHTEICDALWNLNEVRKDMFKEMIENVVNNIILKKFNDETDSHGYIDLDDEPVEKVRGIFMPNKDAITFAMIGGDRLNELRMLSIKMHTLLMNPEPAGDSWKTMIETGIDEAETLFGQIRSQKSPT